MSNNKSPIKEGNEWRFSSDSQPKRTLTMKQQSKKLEALLTMPLEEVRSIAENDDASVFLRAAARKICECNIKDVVALIAEYRKANKRKEVV